jgi:hypothetical protein
MNSAFGPVATTGIEGTSEESAFLGRTEQRLRYYVPGGLVLTVAGVMLLASLPSHTAHLLGAIAVLLGLCFIWSGVQWTMWVLPRAHRALMVAPVDLSLDRWCLPRRYKSWETRLHPVGSSEGEGARFGRSQLPSRRYMKAKNLPVRVYGEPKRGAVVVASSPDGMIVGVISRSSLATGSGS